jgi:hypothetical protein
MSGRSTSRDTYGWKRGNGAYSKDDSSFGNPSYKMDRGGQHDKLARLTDDAEGMGSGNKLTGGGGALSQLYGVGSGKARFPAKTGPLAIGAQRADLGKQKKPIPRSGGKGFKGTSDDQFGI